MKPVAIVAVAGESALGSGVRAFHVGDVGDAPIAAIAEDATLRAAGLRKPFLARVRAASEPGTDPARAFLGRVARMLASELDERLPTWRTLGLGWAVGTSSGGMAPLTEALGRRAVGEPVSRELARAAPYFAPLGELDAVFGSVRERTQVLAACASSAIALGIGCRWLEMGLVDLVVAGGYDAVTPFVAAGFESLGATSGDRPRPFRVGRDGMALGEAAVLFAIVRAEDAGPVQGYIRGFAASSDASHVTAPDREGAGLTRAARAALEDAGLEPSDVGLVSAHATATPFNDAAEARALATIFGADTTRVVVHPFKAIVGHTLGASAALELGAALGAMRRGVLPASAGNGPTDGDPGLRLLSRNESGTVRACLKLSAAFGGANAALVATLDAHDGKPISPVGVAVDAVGEPVTEFDPEVLARAAQIPSVHLARLDCLSGLAVAAAHRAIARARNVFKGRTGVVVGTSSATLENNEAFDRRLRERGPRGVEPRRFPATSPNLVAGQVSIAFGLLGPSLSVGAGRSSAVEALLVAHDLVASGDADAMLIVAAEDVGDVVRSLWQSAGWQVPAHGAFAVLVRRSAPGRLPRSALSALRNASDDRSGVFRGLEPGWPDLRAAVAECQAGG